ncbi:MAG TPA: ABC transporter substrate-binding protein [Erysipelothrix sp.]
MKKASVILLVILLIFGCQSKANDNPLDLSQNDEKVELEFWTFWGSELRRPIIERIIDDFNASQDRIVVKHIYNPYGDIWTKELAAIASGNPPDVVINDINATAIRGKKQRAESISPYTNSAYAKQFFPHLWDAMIYEDEAYAAPFTTDTRVLFYNKDLFKAAGLDPDKPPTTWAELIAMANQLDQKENGDYKVLGFYPLYNVGADVWMINANGQNYIDKEGNVSVDTETNRRVLTWLLERKNHYGKTVVDRYQAKVDGDQSHPFLTQELAMVAATGTFYRQIKDYAQDFELGVAYLPEFEKGTGHTSWGGGFVAEIPFGAKNPDASWEFINYLTDVHAQTLWGALNFDNVANIEASKAVLNHEELSDEDKAVYQVLDENLKHTILTPAIEQLPNYYEIVNPILDEILLERISVEEGLKQIQNQLEQEISNGS